MRERKTKGDLTLILQMMAGCSSTAGALLTGSLPQQDDGSAFLLQFLTWMERYLEDKGTTFAQACADKMLRLGVVFEVVRLPKKREQCMEEIALAHPQNELLLTVPQAARALNVGRSVIYELLLAGEIASIKIGRSRRVVLASLQEFIARHLSTAIQKGEVD